MEDFDFWAVEQSNGESLKILSRGSHVLGEEKRPKPCELVGDPGGGLILVLQRRCLAVCSVT